MEIEQRVTDYLKANPKRWGQIAAAAEIDRSWPYKFMAGKIPNPTLRTFKKLDAAIRQDRRRAASTPHSSRPPL